MRKEEVKTIKRKAIVHNFYCDMCEKYLGRSFEYDDGYVEEIGEVTHKMYIEDLGWYVANNHFCKECLTKYRKNLEDNLISLGFRKG